jgi:hypothetical protein
MPTRFPSAFGITCLVVIPLLNPSTSGLAIATPRKCAECDRVVARALKLLPRQPQRVVVVDAESVPPALRRSIQWAEGFATPGDVTVYLKKQGVTFRHALRGAGNWDYALAAVIWHEMAHIDGADEAEAQRREELLWQQFIAARRIDAGAGLRYFAVLRKRRSSKLDLATLRP